MNKIGLATLSRVIVMLLTSMFMTIYGQHAHAERRVALIIGNSDYTTSPLKNSVNDARDMREQLHGLGFDKKDIVYRENLKKDDIGAMLREWRNRLVAGPDTVALVFYAGHGVQIRGENFFPAVDARIDSEEDVPRQAVKLAELLSVLSDSKTRINLVFLDACRNNPYARGFRDDTRGLAPVKPATGTLIAYATEPGAVASDGKGRNGVFTANLLANMTMPGLAVELMLKKVSEDVFSSTQGKQSPWQEGSIRGYFYFNEDDQNFVKSPAITQSGSGLSQNKKTIKTWSCNCFYNATKNPLMVDVGDFSQEAGFTLIRSVSININKSFLQCGSTNNFVVSFNKDAKNQTPQRVQVFLGGITSSTEEQARNQPVAKMCDAYNTTNSAWQSNVIDRLWIITQEDSLNKLASHFDHMRQSNNHVINE